MNEIKANLKLYCLEAALAGDRADNNDCFVLDVGRDDEGKTITSLSHVIEKVDDYLINVYELVVPIAKLYIVGDWSLAQPHKSATGTEGDEVQDDPELHKHSAEEQEWHVAAAQIAKLIAQMPALRELTWISDLPFLPCILDELPTSMTKIILDLGQRIHLHQDGAYSHKAYITPADMKPLSNMMELKELRLFSMHDSLQPVVWETVFRNKAEGGMRVLDLQMAAAPLVRTDHWRKAQDVVGLTVVNEDVKDREYKGVEGKGILHYSFGTGEYLDDFCMRKARIASGSEESKPLPLLCLKLDGFVIDHLPFEHELSLLVLLTCGDHCIDAGLSAPKSTQVVQNTWSKAVNNVFSHCLIQWPKWTGIFDDRAHQRDLRGKVVAQEAGLSTPINEDSSSLTIPLTKESLDMKELDDTLDRLEDDSHLFQSTILLSSSAQAPPRGSISNASTRGSDVPTPTVEGSTLPSSDSSDSSVVPSVVPINSADNADPVVSANESFEQVTPLDVDGGVDVSTAGSAHPAVDNKQAQQPAGFNHKGVNYVWDGGAKHLIPYQHASLSGSK
ncbi:Nn.00g033190.m01.CDS01 [Neocucurbitaria sp. VM-36]